MHMEKKYKCLITVIVLMFLLVVTVVLGMIRFETPIHRSLHVFDENGVEFAADLNLEAWRSFFKPDKLSGYIILDGIRYISAEDVSNINYPLDVSELFSEPGSRTFVFWEEGSSYGMYATKLLVSMDDYSCKDVTIWRHGEGVSEVYATPGYYDR